MEKPRALNKPAKPASGGARFRKFGDLGTRRHHIALCANCRHMPINEFPPREGIAVDEAFPAAAIWVFRLPISTERQR